MGRMRRLQVNVSGMSAGEAAATAGDWLEKLHESARKFAAGHDDKDLIYNARVYSMWQDAVERIQQRHAREAKHQKEK